MSTPTDCCPQLEPCEPCEIQDIVYRLPYQAQVGDNQIPVVIGLHFQHRRCAGPLALGPLVYTQTLMPGERVRLATSDKTSRFSFDSSTQIAHYAHSSSEETVYSAGFAQAVSSVDIVDSGRKETDYHESAVSGGGGASVSLFGIIEIGGGAKGSSFDASATEEFTRNISRHARSSHRRVAVSVRDSSSTSVRQVSSRTHREGESESHFEASSRTFENRNMCRALTFLFHQIVKCQEVEFTLEEVTLSVADPEAPTVPLLDPVRPVSGMTVVPQAVPANDERLLEVQRAAITAAEERKDLTRDEQRTPRSHEGDLTALDSEVRRLALEIARRELMEAGLIDLEGNVTEEAQERYGWSDTLELPTPGVMVRSCLDECDACEPELRRRIELDLERMALENRKLEREIELMEMDQEHRCCPGEESGS